MRPEITPETTPIPRLVRVRLRTTTPSGAPLRRLVLAPVLLTVLALLPAGAQQRTTDVPSPEAHFGFRMGAEGQLVDWREMLEYLRRVASASDRVRVEEVGRTTADRPFAVVAVSEPDTLRDLDAIRETQRQLASPQETTEEDAARLARQGKAVVVVGAGIHSMEVGSMQMMPELVHRLASDRSEATTHLLRNLVVLLVPSQNPDGLQMLVEWQRRNAGTSFEDAPLPELYHPYAGHDNNRDAFMQTQVETRHLSRLLYHEWLPEVYLDLHQMGSTRARIFVPPFRSPVNPNIDPLVWSEVNLLGQLMAARLQSEGRSGVLWGETYSGYWQGANSSMPWWHNIVGLLSEVASAGLTGPVFQDGARPAPGSLSSRPEPPSARPRTTMLPPPPDVRFRMTYPDPWLGGEWTSRDVVEYHLLATLGLLEGVANNRTLLKENFYRMNARTVARFTAGTPRAFVIPAEQRDPGAAAHLVRVLQRGGGLVERTTAAFTADGRHAGAGSFAVPLAQPFGRWLKDLLEAQVYPETDAAGPVRPYDVTGWTLGMLMGVDVWQLDEPLTVPREPLAGEAPLPAGRLTGAGNVFALPRASNAAATAINEWLDRGARVSWSPAALPAGDGELAPGTFLVRGISRKVVARTARARGLEVRALPEWPAGPHLSLRTPRIALLDPWGGSIDAGWTRWVLEQHGFTYERIRPPQAAGAGLTDRFDVLVIPDGPALQLVRGLQGAHVRPEHRGGLGDAGIAALRRFVEDGGTIVTLGSAAQFAIDHLDIPVIVAARADDPQSTHAPGTILRVELQTDHPLGYGLPALVDAVFVGNAAYGPGRGGDDVTVVGRFPDAPLLRSGYLRGEGRLRGHAVVLDAPRGRGRVVILGPRVQHRGQTHGTFKLLFNAIFAAASGRIAPAAPTQQ